MEKNSTYKNLDLQTATVYDLADLFPDQPPVLISPEEDLTDEQERILSLYTYAENYNITDLLQKLETLFKEELSVLS